MHTTLTSTGGRARLEKNKKRLADSRRLGHEPALGDTTIKAVAIQTKAAQTTQAYPAQVRAQSDYSGTDGASQLSRRRTRELPAQAVFTIIARVKRLAWQSRTVANKRHPSR